MKFSSSVIILLFLFFIAAAASASVVEETPDDASSIGRRRRTLVAESPSVVDETPDNATGPGRRRRKLVAKSNGVHPETAAQTPAPTSYLAVQTGQDCSISAQQASAGIYTLRATVGQETILFSERPEFEKLFITSYPNTAITFTGNKEPKTAPSSNNNRPLIVQLSQPCMVGSSSIIEYTMTQSKSQGEFASIEQFLETSSSCSIFIDSLDDICLPLEGTLI